MPLLFILDSLGTSELLLILAVALIFFGPRKLPQISKQIGKSLAEFRKASDEFKSTWAREVALETEPQPEPWNATNATNANTTAAAVERSAPANTIASGVEPVETTGSIPEPQSAVPADISPITESVPPEPARKSDWL